MRQKKITPILLAAAVAVPFLVAGSKAAFAQGFGNFVSNMLGGVVNGIANAAMNAISGVFNAVVSAVSGLINGAIAAVGGFLNNAIASIIKWIFGSNGCGTSISSTKGTVGDVICNVINSSTELPGFISGIAYLMGMVMAVTALIKLKDHVENPGQHPFSAAAKRFVAGGALFMLPTITSVLENTLTGGANMASSLGNVAGSAAGAYGLDTMMVALIVDIFGPLTGLLGAFGYLAGTVLTVVGISRLLKTAQDGPSGPTGLGTIMTFIVAGVLFTLPDMMGAFSGSLFGDKDIATFAVLKTTIDNGPIDQHVLAVISSVMMFMMLVGWISFIRGFFILRDVAEGKQASLMAAMTHIFGGALAVNIGPLMNAVQSTFGLSGLGVVFT